MYITTFTGKKFHFDPEKLMDNEIDIKDIAHSLSNICRFNGHVKKFMSVAEHSYNTSLLIPQEWALHALLHDGIEAYIGDITTPLKQHINGWKAYDNKIKKLIYIKFELRDMPQSIKEIKIADEKMLRLEAETLLKYNKWANDLLVIKRPFKIKCWKPYIAKSYFLYRFYTLYGWDNEEKQTK